MTPPKPRPQILEIAPYQGGLAKIAGLTRAVKLSANETPLGPSPRAIAAARATLREAHRYPDGHAAALRQALAEHHELPLERIICGNGSGELISLLVQAYCEPGDEVLFPRHAFLMFALAAKAQGAIGVSAPETDLCADVGRLLEKVTERTRIVFLANPNNPTGTYVPVSAVARLRARLPDGVLLVLDGAYAEYVERADYDPGAKLARERDDTVMLRTFSKIYGLAAMRLGWALAPPAVIEVLNKIREPFNVNGPAQAAGIAALADRAWVEAARAHNRAARPKLAEGIRALGLDVTDSVANFLLIRFPSPPKDARAAYRFLTGRGVIPRAVEAYGLADCLRLTVGLPEENEAALSALTEFVQS
jgi:histidinol-phosphate aminotransferase